tara:strand:+ start:35829 stop:37004 length:1176 start_codon:yes stop_codon:yes gene_type:complete
MSNIAKTKKTPVKKRKPLLAKAPQKVTEKEVVEKKTTKVVVDSGQNGKNAEFVGSLNAQLSKINFLNAKYLPINAIQLDPNNPRELSIDLNDVRNGPKLPEQTFDDEVQDEFKEKLRLHFDGDNDKKQKINDYLSVALLAATIKEPEKLMQPICVYEKGNRYVILAGERRTLAHHVMGAQHIAANIIAEPDAKEKALLQYIENSAREDLPLKDKYKAIRNIIHHYGETISVRSLASILRLSKSQAQKYAKICKEENVLFKRAVESGVLSSPEDAYNLIKNNDSESISSICNFLLKGKGIEEALKSLNPNLVRVEQLSAKRIIGANEKVTKRESLTKNSEQITLKGEDLKVLRQLIQIAINAGKLEGFREIEGESGMTDVWEIIKDKIKKVK